jgi:YfiH family protein
MLETVRPEPIRSPVLDGFASNGIRHGFFTRRGGVSDGIYAGLNVGTGSSDDPDRVAENRRRVSAWLGVRPGRLVTVHQVHSPDAIAVDAPFPGERPKADAMVTDKPGLALGVLAADCGPVLYADPEARVIGAAHAGWKGALTGVLEATVEAMERLGAERGRIAAVLGPSISQANYEVGKEFLERFTSAGPANAAWFSLSKKPGHYMFDLNGYTLDRLRKAGVAAYGLDRCTYADEAHFFSYRRTTHRAEPDYGRQISAIVLEDI